MQTLYIDVYFLINLTVDTISLHFAHILSKVPRSIKRITISSVIGSLVASLIVFISSNEMLRLLISVVTLFIMCIISSGRIGFRRRIKFLFAFLIFEALIGGFITLLWSFLDELVAPLISDTSQGSENPEMLFFALIILLSIGVFKMLVSFFSNISSEGSLTVEIVFFDKRVNLDAFIDSGNLAKDPMDSSPVLFIKKEAAKKFLPSDVIDLRDPDKLDRRVRKRIRLIPISQDGRTKVLIGVKADSVNVLCNGRRDEISVTVAIDKEEGDFGGFSALMPSAAIEDVIS